MINMEYTFESIPFLEKLTHSVVNEKGAIK